jgi:hypothetical protein
MSMRTKQPNIDFAVIQMAMKKAVRKKGLKFGSFIFKVKTDN